jgi:ABC-type dipeptide/oligopeptide/nickel transport system permease component
MIQESKKKNNNQSRILMIFILMAIVVILIFAVKNIIPKNEITKQKAQAVQEELLGLQQSHATLENDLKYINTTFGQEALLREKYGVGKEGEEVIVIYDEESYEVTSEVVDEPGFFQRIFKRN